MKNNLEKEGSLPREGRRGPDEFDKTLERLKAAVGAASETQLARALDIKQPSIATARQRGTVPPSWILKIAKNYGESADWLAFGREGGSPASVSEVFATDSGRAMDIIWVPKVRARLSAGHGSLEAASDVEGYYAFRRDWLIRKGDPNEMRLMKVTGDSMEPDLKDGDSVLIDQSQTDILPGLMYATALDDEVLVKYIDKAPGCHLLRSANERYKDITIDPAQVESGLYYFRVVGRVIWLSREVS